MLNGANINAIKEAVPSERRPQADAKGQVTAYFGGRASIDLGASFAADQRYRDALDHHNLSMNAADDGEKITATGRVVTGSGAVIARNHQSLIEQKKKDEEGTQRAMKASLEAMKARLAELDVLIAETQVELDKNAIVREANAQRITALEEVDQLAREGKLDPNDPEHAEKLRLLGMSYSEAMDPQARERRRLEEEAERVLLWNQHIDLTHTYDTYTSERDDIADQVEHIANDPGQTPDVRAEASLIREARELRTEQRAIERSGGIEQTDATDALKHEEAAIQSDEDQLETFSKRLAQIKQIPKELERLKAEQELVQGLSEDAQMMASFDPAAEHLFVEGYFDRLRSDANLELAAATQPAQGPTFTN